MRAQGNTVAKFGSRYRGLKLAILLSGLVGGLGGLWLLDAYHPVNIYAYPTKQGASEAVFQVESFGLTLYSRTGSSLEEFRGEGWMWGLAISLLYAVLGAALGSALPLLVLVRLRRRCGGAGPAGDARHESLPEVAGD